MSFLSDADHELAELVENEVNRQRHGLELIPSENIVSRAVLEAVGSPLTNKYSEGYPGKRYYGGNQVIDQVETLAIERAKKLFGAEHANVQPHAGSQANMAAYFAMCQPGDAVMAMDLAQGGHLTHGSPVNFSGKLYRIIPYGVSKETERIDMDEVRAIAVREKPKMIIAGFTAYPRHLDFARFRAIAEEVGAYLMVDMAHFAGLVAAKVHPDPVPYADVVTTTTHKTLRGPRSALVLSKIEDRLTPPTAQTPAAKRKTLAQRVDSAVFPGLQGGPLEHTIAAKAVAFKEAMRPEFVTYQKQVIKNAAVLGEALTDRKVRLTTGGTDNHLLLLDLTPLGIGGKVAQTALDAVGISSNMNMIPFDPRKPMDPSGLRIGTPSITSRGFTESEMDTLAACIVDAITGAESSATRERVAKKVRELADQHPVYPGYTVL